MAHKKFYIKFWKGRGRQAGAREMKGTTIKFHAPANLISNLNQSKDMINFSVILSNQIHELLILCVMHPSISIEVYASLSLPHLPN